MIGFAPVVLVAAWGLGPGAWGLQVSSEVLAEIRVHGNLVVSNEDVLAIAGLTVGQPFGPDTIEEVTGRLRASKKFDEIQVLKRFASIDDPTRIALVIIVNEGPVRLRSDGDAISAVRRRGIRNMMWLPVLDAEDGYGLTYGVRFALVGTAGSQSRLSFPLTWGGMRRAGVELDRRFTRGPIRRLELGATIQRQKNPAFLENDDRRRLWARVERARGPVRAHGTADWQRVSFAGDEDTVRSIGADVAFDTRRDPAQPRNAVYAIAAWERLDFDSRPAANRTRLEARGYLGLIGQTVLALRAVREDADQPLPRYLKSLLGGWSTLRGFEAGSFAGDMKVAQSAELRMPLTSPLNVAKLGVSVFVDAGTAYDEGQRYRDQKLRRGLGGSVWLAAAVFHVGVSVAQADGGGRRVNFGGGLTF